MSSLDPGVIAPKAFADSVRRSALDAARQIEDPRWKATALTRIVPQGRGSRRRARRRRGRSIRGSPRSRGPAHAGVRAS